MSVIYSLCWIFSEFFEPKDLVLSTAEKYYHREEKTYSNRYAIALSKGAIAYIPTEMIGLCTRDAEYGENDE